VSMPTDHELKQLEMEMREPLSRLLVKPVLSSDTAKLIQSLQSEFESLKYARPSLTARDSQIRRPSLLRLMRAQLASYPKSFWLASLTVFAMLTLIFSYGEQPPYSTIGDLFAFFMPAFLLAGLLYSFRTWNKGMRTIEGITPYPPALLLLCRILLVIALNIGLGLLCTLYLSQRIHQFPFFPFLLEWLSQMLLVGGLLAYLMLWKGMKTAMGGGVVLWIAWNVFEIAVSKQSMLEINWLVAGQITAIAAGGILLVAAYRRSLGMRLLA
jgi:hypothetical protein